MGRVSKLRQNTDLLQKFHGADLCPVLFDFAILQTINVNLAPGDALVGWLLTHHRSFVRRSGRASFNHPVARRDQIFFLDDDIGKSSIHHTANLLQALKAVGNRSSKVMNKVLRVEKVVHSINVMLVLKYAGEIPDDLLIAILVLHVIAPFGACRTGSSPARSALAVYPMSTSSG